MRIGIDARELSGHPTGVGRYLAGLLRQWSHDASRQRHEFLLYTTAAERLPAGPFTPRVVAGAGGTAWEQRALPAALAADRPDVFFSPGYTTPLLTRVPRVVAMHDVSFAAHPEWFTLREGLRRRTIARLSARRAAAVITISDFSRGEIVEHLGVPAGLVQVIPPGIDPPRLAAPLASADSDDNEGDRGPGRAHPSDGFLPRTASVLYVGSIFNRRRVPDLIRATGLLAREHGAVHLDLVGDNRSFPRQEVESFAARNAPPGVVRWHRYVSEAELARLYAAAGAFAFLSEYEGLGLTPLEALSVGVPPVLLDTRVARESCGDAALYVSRGNVRATADALAQLLFEPAVRQRILSAAPAVLRRYDWAAAARQTLAVLERSA